VEIPTARPFTLYGLCRYLGVNTKYFNDFKKTASEDFSEVIRRIEEVIKMQKLEGAMVGAFNANIVARDLGLTDRQEINLDRLTDEQLDQIIEKITGQSNR
ncbi:MAG TPA: terminase small subunit, partial [Segetibacter sp.]|nr:terminase small subunit [Segetibacter sp.]